MRKTDTAKRQYPFDAGVGWYIVEGLGAFGATAEDFTGPYATHQEALDKLATYRGNDAMQIFWIGGDGFAYVDQEGAHA